MVLLGLGELVVLQVFDDGIEFGRFGRFGGGFIEGPGALLGKVRDLLVEGLLAAGEILELVGGGGGGLIGQGIGEGLLGLFEFTAGAFLTRLSTWA